ncbi:hypothetical protein MTO96_025537 [Rhipicephalus appendiculatus]
MEKKMDVKVRIGGGTVLTFTVNCDGTYSLACCQSPRSVTLKFLQLAGPPKGPTRDPLTQALCKQGSSAKRTKTEASWILRQGNVLALSALILLPLLEAYCPRLAPDVISGKIIPCRYLCIRINFFELPSNHPINRAGWSPLFDAPPTQARSLQKRRLHPFRFRRVQGGFRQSILSRRQVRLRSFQEDSPPHQVNLPDRSWTPGCTPEAQVPRLVR